MIEIHLKRKWKKMRWRFLLGGAAFVGAFSLGAMLTPITESTATTINKEAVYPLTPSQTAVQKNVDQERLNSYCPISGETRGVAGMGKQFAGSMSEQIAKALGMTMDELRSARVEGKSVADLAKEKGVNEDNLVADLLQARKSELEQLVKNGKITQERMDAMLDQMESNIEVAIQRNTVGPMNGQGGKKGMGQGRGWNGNSNNQQIQQGNQL